MNPKWYLAGFILISGAALAQDPPSRVARLNLLNGPVSFQPASVDDWTAATVNYPLTTGDHLYADQGARAEMHIGDNAIRLNSMTNFGFLNLDDSTVQMRLTQGNVNIRLRNLFDTDVWEVDTPNGAISLVRAGDYRIDTDPERNATMVTVRSGQVEVTANGQSFPIRPGQTAYFTGDGSPQEVQSANPPDAFDSFCFDLDRRTDTLPPPRYVSRDMVGYEDLDANGVWSQVPEYGPVWRPRAVPVGWAPYRNGHWAWVEPWGWTWIDDAPWGFAPFHYGRWAYVGGGWGWCPGPVLVARPVYAPALVAFVGGGGWSASLRIGGGGGVAWFPLGPREIYVPSYHVSEGYVRHVNVMNVTNINTVNITNINVNRVYVNQRVPGAVVAVSRTDFVGARPVGRVAVRVDSNAVASARVVAAGPGVAPERESVFGRAGGQGYVARPAPAVFNRPVIARATPPPPPVAFAAKQRALEANGGRPLDPNAIRSLQQSQAQVVRPAVRAATQPGSPAIGGFGRSAQPAQNNNGFGRPMPQSNPAPNNGGFGRPAPQAQPAQNNGNFERPAQQDRMNSRPPGAQPAPTGQPAQNDGNFGRPAQQPNFGRPAPQTQPSQNNGNFERPAQQDRMNSRPPAPQPAPAGQPAQNDGNFERPAQQDRMNSRPPAAQPAPAAQPNPAPNNRGFGRPAPQSQPAQNNNNFERPAQQDRMNSRPPAAPPPQPPANANPNFGRDRVQERPQPTQPAPNANPNNGFGRDRVQQRPQPAQPQPQPQQDRMNSRPPAAQPAPNSNPNGFGRDRAQPRPADRPQPARGEPSKEEKKPER